ncbi:MAG TPA: hypothetical protein VFD03_07110 [Clostridia bacterium]|nr:hypothetical protein [Clostridia bacterium]
MCKLTYKDSVHFLLIAFFVDIVLNKTHPAIVIYGLPAGVVYGFIATGIGIIVACILHPKQKKPSTFD